MGYMGATNMISQGLMKMISSVSFVAAESGRSMSTTFFMTAGSILNTIFTFMAQIVYFVAKWVLYFTDIMFFYIKQLAGLDMDTSSLNKMLSKESDMALNFLFSNSSLLTQIIRTFIGLAVIMIIIFSIIAIIKNQYQSINDGKPRNLMEVFKHSIKAILLMLVTPMMFLVGIVASNLLLKSLYSATNVYSSASLGTELFMVSSNSANRYREYASNGVRIPITFDFSAQEELLEYYKNHKSNSKMNSYLESAENTIYSTYLMFSGSDFDDFSVLDEEVNQTEYYKVYDKNLSTNKMNEYRRIRANREEYYVMGDVLDYAISSTTILHMKSIQDVCESICNLPTTQAIEEFNRFAGNFGVEFYDEEDLNTPITPASVTNQYGTYTSYDWEVIRWTSIYYSPDETGGPGYRKQIQYNHIKDTHDEINGSVYVMVAEKSIVIGGTTYHYWYPLTRGFSNDLGYQFDSEYIQRDMIIAAKGVFNKDGYPTAIKETGTRDGLKIVFYRDVLEELVLGESGEIINMDYKEEDGGIISKITSFIKKLFSPAKLLPEVNLDSEAMVQTYTKVTAQVGSVDNGEIHVGYMFSDLLTSFITNDKFGLQLYALFNPRTINYMVLLFGSFMLAKVCMMSVFALIRRAYELLLIFMIYPVACSTMPLDLGSGYAQWNRKYMTRLFSTYGLILGLNFVLMLFPVIKTIKVFKPEDIVSNIAVARFSKIFAMLNISINLQATLLNGVFALMLELVALSMISAGEGGFYTMVMEIVKDPKDDSKETLYTGNLAQDMMGTVTGAVNMIAQAGGFAGKVLSVFTKKGREEMKGKMKSSLPGSALLNDFKDKAHINEIKMEKDMAMDEAKKMASAAAAAAKVAGEVSEAAGDGGGGGGA